MQTFIDDVFSEADYLFGLRKPVHLHRQKMNEPSQDRSNVLHRYAFSGFSVDLETNEWKQENEFWGEAFFEVL